MRQKNLHKLLQQVLVKPIDTAILGKILKQSSFIYFEDAAAVIFKKGEYLRGFYLILDGAVFTEVKGKTIWYKKGYMVGLESFLKKERILKNWYATSKTSTLFINLKCYHAYFETNDLLRNCINHQLTQTKSSKVNSVY